MTFLSFISIPFLYIIAEFGSYADFFLHYIFFSVVMLNFQLYRGPLIYICLVLIFLSGFIHITDLFFLYF